MRLDGLNKEQREAVVNTKGPLLILAGAGSGKTRVLTHRIAYLIEEEGVDPFHIMAITFTNKAAKEMRTRVDDLVGYGSENIWVATFHSTCVRILRRFIDRLGYSNHFIIYDTDDQKTVMKEVYKYLKIDPKQLPEKSALAEISKAKDKFLSPSEYESQARGDYQKTRIAQIYREYQNRLKSNDALDFDDLLVKTVELFQFHPDVLELFQERFQYIMVDEYQDTNHVQFLLIHQLASKYRNLCVVGDDDQSIYKFRGANIYNILDFEKEFPDTLVIKLEQNYRSTKNILTAANEVIKNNNERKVKKLWCENEEGELIRFRQNESEYEEGEYVAAEIDRMVQNHGASYHDFAVLYRTNAQSRIIEEKLLMNNIPYKIVGGQNFYGRKEIKDLICYLKTICNGHDDLAVKRILNVPKRGIGATTIAKVEQYAQDRGIDFYQALMEAENISSLGKALGKIQGFCELIEELKRNIDPYQLDELLDEILEKTGYAQELEAENTEESRGRLENIDEFRNKIVDYLEKNDEPSLEELLEEIALVADIDTYDETQPSVVLMTFHSAKGLEFPNVFMVGMEEGLFPSYMSVVSGSKEELEEERRLCYVGITRARERLCLSCAKRRMIHGETRFSRVSRFVAEIPEALIEQGKKTVSKVEKPKRGNAQIGFVNQNPYQKKEFPGAKETVLDYQVGDQVKHIKFGVGTVKEIVSGGRDYEVTVEFETAGVKKMFASFAKLKKVEG